MPRLAESKLFMYFPNPFYFCLNNPTEKIRFCAIIMTSEVLAVFNLIELQQANESRV